MGHRSHFHGVTIAAIVCLLAIAICSAQSTMVAPGSIRCADCAATGQQPAAPAYDELQIGLTAQPRPAFRNNATEQVAIIARVLMTSPLVLEVLDFQHQLLDANLQTMSRDASIGRFPATCGIVRVESVDLRSKAAWSTLQFNDLVTARWMYKRNERKPADFFAATLVLTGLRKVSEPIPYFHSTPLHESCSNRSGRLVIYQGPVVDRVIVFNDGSISYRNALFRDFTQERLSSTELTELLKAFGAANFDQLPANIPAADATEQSTLTLLGARYQNVSIEGRESALAPLVRRMDDLAARATARTQLVLTAGKKTRITTLDWPYAQIPLAGFRERKTVRTDPAMQERVADDFLGKLPLTRPPRGFADDPNRHVYVLDGGKLFRVTGNPECRAEEPTCRTFYGLDVAEVVDAESALKATHLDYRIPGSLLGARPSGYLWSADMGMKLSAVPTAGIVISKAEYDKHTPLYFEILKAKASGLNFVDDGFFYEGVRLCQTEPGAADDCSR
jgi:hypothetical protein